MAITNLHKAKHLNKNPVSVEELRIGMIVDFPSGMGGSFTCRLESLDEDTAVFKSTMKDWPATFICKLNEPDLTPDEFKRLEQALIDCGNLEGTPEQRNLMIRAGELGYFEVRSTTQIYWTQKGLDAVKAIKEGEAA
jgi:hypothetical protein